MFVLKAVDLNTLHAMELTTEQFWIQLHQLPMGCMDRTIGEQIGNSIGRVIMVDVPVEDLGGGP